MIGHLDKTDLSLVGDDAGPSTANKAQPTLANHRRPRPE